MIYYESRFDTTTEIISMTLDRGYSKVEPHFHKHIEMQYIINGSVEFAVDGQTKTCTNGMLIFIFPYQIHSNLQSYECRSISGIIQPENFKQYKEILFMRRAVSPFIKSEAIPPDLDMIIHYLYNLYITKKNIGNHCYILHVHALSEK